MNKLEKFKNFYNKRNKKTDRRILDEYIDKFDSLSDAFLETINKKGLGSLMFAIKDYEPHKERRFYSKLDAYKAFLQAGYDVNKEDIYGNSILNYVCQHSTDDNKEEIAKLLIDNGADVNKKDRNGKTALHQFAESKEMVEFLIEKGADIEALDNKGFTPIYYSLNSHFIGATDAFIKHGANVNAVNKYDVSPLHIAIFNEDMLIVKKLLKNGATEHINTPITDYYFMQAFTQSGVLSSSTTFTPYYMAKTLMLDTSILESYGAIPVDEFGKPLEQEL